MGLSPFSGRQRCTDTGVDRVAVQQRGPQNPVSPLLAAIAGASECVLLAAARQAIVCAAQPDAAQPDPIPACFD
jgi:hypothetical protein